MSSRRHISLSYCHGAHLQTHLFSNQWPCSTAAQQASTNESHRERPLVNYQTNRWRSEKKFKLQVRSLLLHICTQKSIYMEIPESSSCYDATYLLVSVVVLLFVTVLDEDLLSTMPCPPTWACICEAAQSSACGWGEIKNQRVLPASSHV